ncbi:AAA family ATPase [Chondrinema litorale]|uniref:AAA family ATPase n=1 Tax=Chondrinema litorale TaxID=2994555 RepID=UPI002542A206|nr:AAA family ATPase [Chondrinema litorale]UZS00231.1 AAA family ATPase [Chondrinema litorale]
MDNNNISKNIKRLRANLKVNQGELAEKTGISKPTIQRIEQGTTTADVGQLSKIAAALGTEITTLLQVNTDVISVVNQKGGVGKSTLCSLVAVQIKAKHPEKSIVIIDTDYQSSTKKLDKGDSIVNVIAFDVNESSNPILEFVDLVEKLKKEYDLVVVDTAGSFILQNFTSTVVECSSVVLIPIEVNELSISGSMITIPVVLAGQERRAKKGLKALASIIVNKAKKVTLEQKEIAKMGDLAGIEILKTKISDRIRYSRELSLSKPMVDPKDKTDELNILIDELLTKIDL